jgi:hypothetical protein
VTVASFDRVEAFDRVDALQEPLSLLPHMLYQESFSVYDPDAGTGKPKNVHLVITFTGPEGDGQQEMRFGVKLFSQKSFWNTKKQYQRCRVGRCTTTLKLKQGAAQLAVTILLERVKVTRSGLPGVLTLTVVFTLGCRTQRVTGW